MSQTQMQPQEQPEAAVDIFQLTPPKQVEKVTVTQVLESTDTETESPGIIRISKETKGKLESQADVFVDRLLSAQPQDDSMKSLTDFVKNMGASEMRSTANQSNSFLQRPAKALAQMEEGQGVAKTLLDLRKVVEELDPSKREKLWSINKLIKWLPFGSKVDNYFKEYQANETHINAILESLYNGKDSLLRDNATIEVERDELWKTMQTLEQYIYVTQKLSKKIEAILPKIEAQDHYKAKVIREDILFYLKQRHIDLSTNMAVNLQSHMSLDLVRKNNEELIKGVDRATTTTIQALRVAVMVASALSTQRLVLDQIKIVNKTTEELILNNAKMLNEQGVEIHKQAASAMIDPEVLNKAFKDVVSALDGIDKFKAEAIVSMDGTIKNLSSTIDDMKKHLDKNRQKEVAGLGKALSAEPDDGVININTPKI